MATDVKIINIGANNLSEHGIFCVKNIKHEGYQAKFDWLKKRFADGLKLKFVYFKDEKNPVGFIEYIPGEYAWRGVEAKGYMFIHCMYLKSKYRNKGYASRLLEKCVQDARKENLFGVVVIASQGPWLAGKEFFLKNGFELIAKKEPLFELLVKKFSKDAPSLKFSRTREKNLKKYGKGLTVIYANQCPFIIKSIKELAVVAKEMAIKIKIVKLKNCKQAQNAPSPYGVFSILYNGKLLANHYISKTRFKNIINKELK